MMTTGWKSGWGVAMAAVLAAGPALAQPGALTDDVQRLIAGAKLGGARVGVSIRDVETGAVLADVNGSQPMTPASNMKVLTSGAALLVLGPEWTFRTELVLDGDRLIVKGSGDPALADPEVLDKMNPKLTVGDVMSLLTGSVTKAGVKSVREIVVDDRVFDRQYVHPTWPAEKLDRGYSAEVAGLNFHANVILAYPRPNPEGAGTPPPVSFEPEAPWLPITNKARTIVNGKNSVWLSREPAENRFTLHGDVKFPVQVGVEITVHEPPRFFGQLLSDQLKRAGVQVAPGTATGADGPAGVRLAGPEDAAGASARVLAVIHTPIAEVLRRCNSDSANLYAESLLKRTGNAVTREPGTWENGASVLRMLLTQRLGPQMAAEVTVADGSGLSRDNAVPAGVLSKWLEVLAKDDKAGAAFIDSLAVPGEGTLKERFKTSKMRNRVHAKSGFINGVRTLSGYVVDEDSGRKVAFSVMVNDIKTDTQTVSAKELHEQVVGVVDRYLARRSGTRQGG